MISEHMAKDSIKIIANNKKAYHDYFIEEKLEAGLVLLGTEIKSVRKGKVQLKEAYISFINGEAYIKGMNISAYDHGNRNNHDEKRDRKLLLNKREIVKWSSKVKTQGFTVIPLKIYLKNGLAKCEIALAKGKSLYDKREDAKVKTMKMEAFKAIRR